MENQPMNFNLGGANMLSNMNQPYGVLAPNPAQFNNYMQSTGGVPNNTGALWDGVQDIWGGFKDKFPSWDKLLGGNKTVDGKNIQQTGILGQGAATIGALSNVYNAWKAGQMAEDQFEAQKSFGNRNIANQANTINSIVDQRAQHQASQQGLSPEQAKAWAADYFNRNKVDGSPVA